MDPYFNSKRYKKSTQRIINAFNFVDCNFDEVPLIIQTASPAAIGQDIDTFPADYFTNPMSMLEFQTESIDAHKDKIDDDYIPYYWPWYGVCVIPDYFGSKITFPKNGDPAAIPIINSIKKAKKQLKKKDFELEDLTKRTINTIKYFKENGKYPVSVTDIQSPLDCITQIIGYQNLFYWMQDDPNFVDEIMEFVSDIIKDWIKYQKVLIGEANTETNGIVSIKPPSGIGTWFSDDDMIMMSPELYKRFVVPNYNKLFKEFGEVAIHWCGNGNHNLENIVNIKKLKAVHNLFLGDIDTVAYLKKKLTDKKITLITGDIVPVREQLNDYLKTIKENLSPVGLILNFWIYPRLGLKDGKYVFTENDLTETALKILDFFRG